METSKPPLDVDGACTGIILEGSPAGLGNPVAYIAIPVSGPDYEPHSMQATPQPMWWPPSQLPTKKPHQSRLVPCLTERLRKAIGGLGAAQIVSGLTSIVAESILYTESPYFGTVFVGMWCGVLYFITGVIAVIAAKTRRFGPVIATMVMSILSAMFFSCQLGFSAVLIRVGIPNHRRIIVDMGTAVTVVPALETALSLLELIFSVACAACCCRAVCRQGCCLCCINVMAYQNPTPVAASVEELK